MSSLKFHEWSAADYRRPASQSARRAVAAALRSASAMLARLSRRVAVPARVAAPPPARIEFHAEAGAPEGALYLDGKLIGWLPGVRRL